MKTQLIIAALILTILGHSHAEDKIIKGVGLSPQGFPKTYDKLPDFLTEVSSMPNSAVLQVGLWRDGNKFGQIPEGAKTVAHVAPQFGYTPLIVFNWSTEKEAVLKTPGNKQNNWANPEARQYFKEMVLNFVTTYKPKYIFLGNETDFYAAHHPLDYAVWIKVYQNLYDEIKKISPETQVGSVFNFEHLTGTGKLNGWNKGTWGAINSHDMSKMDIVGITTYPWFNHATPQEIPETYFNPLLLKTGNKPIAILETGWPARNHPDLKPLWQASEAHQVSYIQKLPDMIKNKNVKIINWLHLYPMTDSPGNALEFKLFDSVTLYDQDGKPRPAYTMWKNWNP